MCFYQPGFKVTIYLQVEYRTRMKESNCSPTSSVTSSWTMYRFASGASLTGWYRLCLLCDMEYPPPCKNKPVHARQHAV